MLTLPRVAESGSKAVCIDAVVDQEVIWRERERERKREGES